MKGITHFMTGLTAASCFPAAVRAAMDGNPLYFILGGILGLLPDTLDFKIIRFFARRDIDIVPDPVNPDPHMIADGVALAINRAGVTNRPIQLRLATIRIGSDRWHAYKVHLDPAARIVRVELGAIITTDGRPADTLKITNGASPVMTAQAPLAFPISTEYQNTIAVDIFDGPYLSCTPISNGSIEIGFLPWHREWSHSLVAALGAGLFSWWIWGGLAGAVSALAILAHIAGDQAGFMGSQIFFPFSRARTPGLHLGHASDAMWNFGTIWLAMLLLYWNLGRQALPPLPPFALPKLMFIGGALPLAIILFIRRHYRQGA